MVTDYSGNILSKLNDNFIREKTLSVTVPFEGAPIVKSDATEESEPVIPPIFMDGSPYSKRDGI